VIKETEPLRTRASEIAQSTGNKKLAKAAELIWVYPSPRGGLGTLLPGRSAVREKMQSFLNQLLADRGVRKDSGRPFEFLFTMGRDLWAAFVYRRSGFSHLITAQALGHSNLKSLLHYIEKREVQISDRKRLIDLQGMVLADLRHGRYEPRSYREGAPAVRSSKGVECKNYEHPSQEADPGNPGGRPCRAQRCWACFDWYATVESLPYLLRMTADLEAIRTELGWTLWETSDYPIMLSVYEHIISKFHVSHMEAARIAAADLPPIITLARFLNLNRDGQ
jgi:hypothetical protein